MRASFGRFMRDMLELFTSIAAKSASDRTSLARNRSTL